MTNKESESRRGLHVDAELAAHGRGGDFTNSAFLCSLFAIHPVAGERQSVLTGGACLQGCLWV